MTSYCLVCAYSLLVGVIKYGLLDRMARRVGQRTCQRSRQSVRTSAAAWLRVRWTIKDQKRVNIIAMIHLTPQVCCHCQHEYEFAR